MLALEHGGGAAKRRGEAVRRELRVLRQHLVVRRATPGEFKHADLRRSDLQPLTLTLDVILARGASQD